MRLWYGNDGGFTGRATHNGQPVPFADDPPYVHGPVRVLVAGGRIVCETPAPKRRGAPAGIVLPLVERTCPECGETHQSAKAERCEACGLKRQRRQQSEWSLAHPRVGRGNRYA